MVKNSDIRELNRDDVSLNRDYPTILKLFPDAKFVIDEQGTYRFKEDPLIAHITDHSKHYIDLNQLWDDMALKECKFGILDMARFYQDFGVSLSGFLDMFRGKINGL